MIRQLQKLLFVYFELFGKTGVTEELLRSAVDELTRKTDLIF